MTFAGHVAIVGESGNPLARLVVIIGGIAAMAGLASLVSWYNSTKVSFRVVDPGLRGITTGNTAAAGVTGPLRRPVERAPAPS